MFSDLIQSVNSYAAIFLSPLDIPLLNSTVRIALIVLASTLAPSSIPSFLQDAMTNKWGRILFMTLLVYLANKDFSIALLSALCFVVSLNLIQGKSLFEKFAVMNGGIAEYGAVSDLEATPAVTVDPSAVVLAKPESINQSAVAEVKAQVAQEVADAKMNSGVPQPVEEPIMEGGETNLNEGFAYF